MKFRRYSWILPFLVVVFVYGNEALGVFGGEPEHYEIVSGLGLSNLMATSLVWLSVVIEVAVIAAVFWKPSSLTFSIAALWPWVPRVLSTVTGAGMEMMEMDMSLMASIAAMGAYLAYEELKRIPTPQPAFAQN